MLSLTGILLTLFSRYMNRWNRNYFLAFFSFLAFDSIGSTLFMMFIERTEPVSLYLSSVGIFVQSLAASFLMPVVTFFLVHKSTVKLNNKLLQFSVLFLWLAYLVLLLSTIWSDQIYHISDMNQYYRGPYYYLLLTASTLLMALNLIAFIRRNKGYTSLQKKAIRAVIILPMISMVIQIFFMGIVTVLLGTSLAAMIMFTLILHEQMEIYITKEKETLVQKASIINLQMRPHFICNTLISIYYLCNDDVRKAQDVILNFTRYLRSNFSALAKEDRIPFAEELEHTKTYIAVEKMRYEDNLNIIFDIRCTDFLLPPLTLQPLVENAIKYGIDPESEPLTVTITTQVISGGNEVIVSDTGPGIYNSPDDSGSHIALNNIKDRLSMMCGGYLLIESEKGRGTTVTLRIPDTPPIKTYSE